MQVDPCQLGVIIEHLLEMRDQPARVDAVAGEPSSKEVVHSTLWHCPERGFDHAEAGSITTISALKDEFDQHGLGKLRCSTPATIQPVVAMGNDLRGMVKPFEAECFTNSLA